MCENDGSRAARALKVSLEADIYSTPGFPSFQFWTPKVVTLHCATPDGMTR
jgi:hypothetical protein